MILSSLICLEDDWGLTNLISGRHVGSHVVSLVFFYFSSFLLNIFDSTTTSVNCCMKRNDSREAM